MAAISPIYRKDLRFPRSVTDHAMVTTRRGFLFVRSEYAWLKVWIWVLTLVVAILVLWALTVLAPDALGSGDRSGLFKVVLVFAIGWLGSRFVLGVRRRGLARLARDPEAYAARPDAFVIPYDARATYQMSGSRFLVDLVWTKKMQPQSARLRLPRHLRAEFVELWNRHARFPLPAHFKEPLRQR